MFLEKLIDFLLDAWKWASPFAWVQPWEGGVRITSALGWQRIAVVGPGLHVKCPFLQVIETAEVASTTLNLPPQSLITQDDVPVVAGGVVKFSIRDILPLFTRVVDREDVLRDVALGAVFQAVRQRTWAVIVSDRGDMEREIRGAIADQVNVFGFKVERFTFSDLSRCRSIRLLQEGVVK